MPLTAGEKLGVYEILSPLGAGGMGEVYRARDSKLGREVAIKVLPEEFTQHPQKLARFEREARLLAALNHPGIATLHGLEEAEGKPFLVMELVEGQTLAERISLGPIPVGEALEISREIAEALEAAHEKGIIHRDLKPANVKVDPEGHVKVLDFGLAKAFADDVPDSELSQSPTLSRDATRAGVILGTAAYMSPEQAKGKAVDKRSDIFSFGAVLYEMLTGKKAFGGEDVSDVLASIIKLDIDWEVLPSDLDPRIQKLLVRCLKQDRKKRLRDVGDIRNELEEILAEPPGAAAVTSEPARGRLSIGTAIAGALLLSGIVGVAVWTLTRAEESQWPTSRFTLVLPPGDGFTNVGRSVVALSPDGTRLVYAANLQLYLRELDQLEATPIRGTNVAPTSPFFSPDGQWVGFYAQGNLKKVSATGGAPVTLCEAVNPFGVSWETDDTILFGQGPEGILRVSANGGTPEVVIPMNGAENERAHGPQMLPDGDTVLFTLLKAGTWDDAQIVAQSLETGERRVLVEGGSAGRYLATGHLMYTVGDTLQAVPFDIDRLQVIGGPVPVVEGVARDVGRGPGVQVSISDSGSLVYVPGALQDRRRLVWLYRDGREETLAAEPRAYTYPRISPDGSQVALDVRDQDSDIWIWDLARESMRRLTFDPGGDWYPVWTPDGRYLAFGSWRDGPLRAFWKAADGTGTAERLVESEYNTLPYAFSPDGREMVYRENDEGGGDLRVRSMDDGSSQTLLETESDERNAEISPDGRWLAYDSDASGQYEVYVRPFPNVNEAQWKVSTDGGTRSTWSRDGDELFYLDLDGRLMAVSARTGPTIAFGKPEVISEQFYPSFPGALGRHYDVSPDGSRFLMIRNTEESEPATMILVQNWFEELKRLVPTR